MSKVVGYFEQNIAPMDYEYDNAFKFKVGLIQPV
jgi:hypothetical protein